MTIKLAVIHGTGLIGGSIGLGLLNQGWSVAGWDPDRAALEHAVAIGVIQTALDGSGAALEEADLVVLGGPPNATVSALAELAGEILVTDIAGAKTPIVEAGGHLHNFVAGHPMAGSAASGARFASPHLFHGASWVLCDDTARPAAVDAIADVVSSLGANPIVMSAADHDRYAAMVSHLPRVIASALIALVTANPEATRLSAGSFRDLTRVAGSGADWWSEVLVANRNAVSPAIADLIAILQDWQRELTNQDVSGVTDRLLATREARSHLGAPVAEVRVVLYDRPGEIARVGAALSQSGVDLRDIQLRHAEHGGGGILTLSINQSETDALRSSLAANGFETEK